MESISLLLECLHHTSGDANEKKTEELFTPLATFSLPLFDNKNNTVYNYSKNWS